MSIMSINVGPRGRGNQHVQDPCLINSSVVLPGDKLVVLVKRKMKLIDLTLGQVVDKLNAECFFWDITMLDRTHVAATSPSHTPKKIYIVNVSENNHLILASRVNVDGECRGIARIDDDKVVLTYVNPVKVEIITIAAHVPGQHSSYYGIPLRNVQETVPVVSEHQGMELFTWPGYVAVSLDQQSIYISDRDNNTVTRVTRAGQVLATFRGANLGSPRGLTVDVEGRVYVCGRASHNIIQLTDDLKEIQELLQEEDGVVSPSSVNCWEPDRLCIGLLNREVVKVYLLE